MEQQRKISFSSAVLMSINIIVGVGIYFGPQKMTAIAGNYSFLAWIAAGLLLFPVMWGVAQAALIFPGSGGFYNYGKSGLNETAGFLASWAYFLGFSLVISTIGMALQETVIATFKVPFIAHYPWVFNLSVIAVLSAMNFLPIHIISKIQSIATILKLFPIFFVIGLFPFYWHSSFTFAPNTILEVGSILPLAIFGFWGFESTTSIGSILEGGPTQVFKVAVTAFCASAILYALFHLSILHIMGASQLVLLGVEQFPTFLGIQSTVILSCFSWVFLIVFLLNYINSTYGVMFFNSSNLFNLAQKKTLFQSETLSVVSKEGRPTVIILLQALLVFILMTCMPSASILGALSNFGINAAFTITLLAVLNTFIKQRKFVQMIPIVFGLGACALVYYFSWMPLAHDHLTRFLYVLPLILGFVFGLIMFTVQRSKLVNLPEMK